MSGLRSSSALVATALMALALATQAQESDEMAGAWLMHEVRPWAETEPLEDRLRPAEVASGGVSAQAGSSNTCIRESARCPYPIARTNYDTGRSEGHSGWQQRYIDNKNRVEKGGCEVRPPPAIYASSIVCFAVSFRHCHTALLPCIIFIRGRFNICHNIIHISRLYLSYEILEYFPSFLTRFLRQFNSFCSSSTSNAV